MHFLDSTVRKKIAILREKRKLFHLVPVRSVLGILQFRIAQGRNSHMCGKISADLYGDCTHVAGNVTLKWGDCTGLYGDLTGTPPGNIAEMQPKIYVLTTKTTPEEYGSGVPN